MIHYVLVPIFTANILGITYLALLTNHPIGLAIGGIATFASCMIYGKVIGYRS
jgi:hypothetical protein